MKLSKTRKGELYMFGETILAGSFTVTTVFAYRFLQPLTVLFWSTLIAALFFSVLLILKKKWRELLEKEAWKYILGATFIVGIIYFSIFFLGLKHTTAGDAAIIAETELWSSFVLLGLILKKEKYTSSAIVGASLMFVGVLAVVFSGSFSINIGNLIILFGAMIVPVGNYFAQKALEAVSSITLMFVRSAISSVFFFLIMLSTNASFRGQEFQKVLPVLIFSGLFIFGVSKIFSMEAIKRISIAKSRSIGTLVPVFALAYAFLFLGEIPTIWQILGLVPIMIGITLITKNKFLDEPPSID